METLRKAAYLTQGVGRLYSHFVKYKNINTGVWKLEHKTCDILAAERLRLMRFDNRLIIDSFQKAICILKW